MAPRSPRLVPWQPSAPDRFTVDSVARVSAHVQADTRLQPAHRELWGTGEGCVCVGQAARTREGSSLSGWWDECVVEEEEGDSDA